MNTTAAVKPTPEQLAARKQAAADQARLDSLFASQREALIVALGYQLHQESHQDAGTATKPAWADSKNLAQVQVDAALAAVKNQMVAAPLLDRLKTAAAAKGLQGEQAALEVIALVGGGADRSLLGIELGISDADIKAAREAGLLREFLAAKLAGYQPAAAAPPAPPAPPAPQPIAAHEDAPAES